MYYSTTNNQKFSFRKYLATAFNSSWATQRITHVYIITNILRFYIFDYIPLDSVVCEVAIAIQDKVERVCEAYPGNYQSNFIKCDEMYDLYLGTSNTVLDCVIIVGEIACSQPRIQGLDPRSPQRKDPGAGHVPPRFWVVNCNLP